MYIYVFKNSTVFVWCVCSSIGTFYCTAYAKRDMFLCVIKPWRFPQGCVIACTALLHCHHKSPNLIHVWIPVVCRKCLMLWIRFLLVCWRMPNVDSGQIRDLPFLGVWSLCHLQSLHHSQQNWWHWLHLALMWRCQTSKVHWGSFRHQEWQLHCRCYHHRQPLSDQNQQLVTEGSATECWAWGL